MIGFYNYTVILTYLGTLSGFYGIANVMNNNLKAALLCLMFSGFCDMFDGKVASTMERTPQEKRFGIQIDSLSDLICFGVFPALIVYHFSGKASLTLLIAAAYMLCALIRLAWFNVDEEERQSKEGGRRTVYLGLPVTTSGLLLPMFFGIGSFLKLPVAGISPWLLLVIAIAFITPFQLEKPGRKKTMVMAVVGLITLASLLVM